MLEYSKTIVEKVSFCNMLFEKELGKALKYLSQSEKETFLKWCHSKFRYCKINILKKYSY